MENVLNANNVSTRYFYYFDRKCAFNSLTHIAFANMFNCIIIDDVVIICCFFKVLAKVFNMFIYSVCLGFLHNVNKDSYSNFGFGFGIPATLSEMYVNA